ncbi:alpha/beta fold hydrolase [Micromonospora cremea]|uniref:Pimeloyl-ACP methyl ester carboxylesterase n=1 Tax=Micromonospora cremea TaxID=709881 RepID=A0A1N5UMM4_9ACTN|nr:alpha/beta fold hydrolase [Micromonospora cremea]SIM62002.1 Pimeloyl-ACP methyl ester carboxylesterase [Micromonospora cremea]
MQRITARDGASIALHSTGTGPGLVVVHGGGVTIDVYRRLATALADRFTVHLYNRRGRADAPPRSVPYTFEQDIDDLAAVLEHTGSGNIVGHSFGGFIALQAALRLPIDRLALYDAAVSIDGGFPAAWLDAAHEALRAGDTARSLAITAGGINPQMAAAKLPFGVRLVITRAFLRTPIGRMMGDLLPMTLDESALIRDHDGPASQWAGITAEVLLACGADGPPYYVDLNEALAGALPRARTLVIPRSGHDAINRAHPRLVDPLATFFAAPVTPERTGHL